MFEDDSESWRNKAYKIELDEVYDKNNDGAINLNDVQEILKQGKCSKLKGTGDFRSTESVNLLKQADIVVTNPPFSLFREYVEQLMKYEKNFLILGNNNALTYKDIFTYIKKNKIWLGYASNKTMEFELNPSYKQYNRIENGKKYGKVPAISWFTNLDINRRHEDIVLTKKYNPVDYSKYDNYDAIEVSRVKDIPKDYGGAMGVPITFLGKFNPDQFDIIKFRKGDDEKDLRINGKSPYFRILIKNKKVEL